MYIMNVQLNDLRQLYDSVMSVWTKFSEECFRNLVESRSHRIEAVWKARMDPIL